MGNFIALLTIIVAAGILGWTGAHFEWDSTSWLTPDSTVAASDTTEVDSGKEEKDEPEQKD